MEQGGERQYGVSGIEWESGRIRGLGRWFHTPWEAGFHDPHLTLGVDSNAHVGERVSVDISCDPQDWDMGV